MSTTLEERVARLEALVKKHLPCPHEHTSKSLDAFKETVCDDCGAEWTGSPPEIIVVKINRNER